MQAKVSAIDSLTFIFACGQKFYNTNTASYENCNCNGSFGSQRENGFDFFYTGIPNQVMKILQGLLLSLPRTNIDWQLIASVIVNTLLVVPTRLGVKEKRSGWFCRKPGVLKSLLIRIRSVFFLSIAALLQLVVRRYCIQYSVIIVCCHSNINFNVDWVFFTPHTKQNEKTNVIKVILKNVFLWKNYTRGDFFTGM